MEPRFIISENNQYGFMDITGKEVIPVEFMRVRNFKEGYALVFQPGKCFFIDIDGRPCFGETTFPSANSFSEGLAVVRGPDHKYGYINTDGKMVIEPIYSDAWDFSEGIAAVKLDYHKIIYINKEGKVLFEKDDAHTGNTGCFSEGLVAFPVTMENNDKYGFLDSSGEFVIQPAYDFASAFVEGVARVDIKDKPGLVSTPFHGGYEDTEVWEYKASYIDKKGRPVDAPPRRLYEGLSAKEFNYLWGYIDKDGKTVIESDFKKADNFNNGLAYVEKTKPYVPDERNEIQVIEDFNDEEPDVEYGYIDKSGQFVWKSIGQGIIQY